MATVLRAARLHDPVAHSHALAGFIVGAAVGVVASFAAAAVIGVVVGGLEVATAGLATPLILGVAATALEFGANAYVGTKITQFAESTGERIGSEHMCAPSGQVAQGSPNVFINGLPAARASDAETCDAGVVAQGSASVFINGLPAARLTDKTSCGGQIVDASRNVFIGGPTRTVTPIQPEVPESVRWAAAVAAVVPAIGKAAGALGPALAEIRAGGLVRAAQTGVKALGRAMEERGARALARSGRAPVMPETPPTGQLALPGPEKRLALPEPKPSAYPFTQEPALPAGGKQGIDFKPQRPGLDMNNLSPEDAAAAKAMDKGGWNTDMQKQVLESGDNAEVMLGKNGEPVYKFSTPGRDEAAAPASAYYTDKAGFDALSAKYRDPVTGEWDSPGVKNEIALPCYNTAEAVWEGSLNKDQLVVRSTVNPVTEGVTYSNPDGSIMSQFQRSMTGGGSQLTPSNGGVGGLVPHSGRHP